MEDYDENEAKKDLAGVFLDYTYEGESMGHNVVLALGIDRVEFDKPWPGDEEITPPEDRPAGMSMENRARRIQQGLYLIHWLNRKGNHVALVLDFVDKKTFGAALLFGEELWAEGSWSRWMLSSSRLGQYQ
jgi:hypothetical protein